MEETRLGPVKNQVRRRIQKFVRDNLSSKIVTFLTSYRRDKEANSSSIRSLHSSITDIQSKYEEQRYSYLIDKSGDFEDEEKLIKVYELTESKSNSSVFSKSKETKNAEVSSQTTSEKKVIRNYQKKFIEEKKRDSSTSIDDDIISSSYQSEDFKNKISFSTVQLTHEAKNKDSTIHLSYGNSQDDFESDDDEDFLLPKKDEERIIRNQHSILTSQPQSTLYGNQKEAKEDENFDMVEREEDDSSTPFHHYIDSGLRRLKSEESRLYLDPDAYKHRKPPPKTTEKSSIQPILKELSSDLFKSSRKAKKQQTEVIKKTVKKEPEEVSMEEDSESKSEEFVDDIDETPLHRLKEAEDKTFKINTKDLDPGTELFPVPEKPRPKEEKEDFCIHTKDRARKKTKSKFGFLRNFNLCVHLTDGKDDDTYSIEDKHRKPSTLPKPSKSSLHYHEPSRSKSQGSSSITAIDNKEARRLKRPSKNW